MDEPKLGTKEVAQVAVVVEDIVAAARAWAKLLDVPVPEIRETETVDVTHAEYRGNPTSGRVRMAFFALGNLSLELLEPIDGPSTWRDQLTAHGNSLHHIAFRVQGMADRLADLEADGMGLVQRGEYTGGRYAYVDAVAQLGLTLELLEDDARQSDAPRR